MSDEDVLAWAVTEILMGRLITDSRIRSGGTLTYKLSELWGSRAELTIETDEELKAVALGNYVRWLRASRFGESRRLVRQLATGPVLWLYEES